VARWEQSSLAASTDLRETNASFDYASGHLDKLTRGCGLFDKQQAYDRVAVTLFSQRRRVSAHLSELNPGFESLGQRWLIANE
jgi:hypothetical protein